MYFCAARHLSFPYQTVIKKLEDCVVCTLCNHFVSLLCFNSRVCGFIVSLFKEKGKDVIFAVSYLFYLFLSSIKSVNVCASQYIPACPSCLCNNLALSVAPVLRTPIHITHFPARGLLR